MARKGMHTSVDKNDSEDSDDVGEQSKEESLPKIWGWMGPEDKLEKGFGKWYLLELRILEVYLLSERKYPLSYEVNTPGSDENRLKLYDLMYKIVNVADIMD
ncbi:hypothetical protein Tco_0499696 [Tanacetum coccineum]